MNRTNYYPETVIVIPTYNEADNLPKIVDEISNLGIRNIGFIIIDDGSTDATVEIAQSFTPRFPSCEFCVVRQSNQGPGAARLAARPAGDGPAAVAHAGGDRGRYRGDIGRCREI